MRFLVGDNCSANQVAATTLDVPLVDCASHRLNLATGKVIKQKGDLVAAASALMAALRLQNNRTELERYTELAPLRSNSTH